jgi:hypothetical protein
MGEALFFAIIACERNSHLLAIEISGESESG